MSVFNCHEEIYIYILMVAYIDVILNDFLILMVQW